MNGISKWGSPGEMVAVWLVLAAALIYSGCQNIPYRADTESFNSAQSNSDEFPVHVNGFICKDMDGKVGACVKRIASDEVLTLTMPAMPYAYNLDVTCSFPLGIDFPVDVRKGDPYQVIFEPDVFEDWKLFTCKGEVNPFDRPEQKDTSKWHVRILVVDKNYRPREIIYKTTDGKWLVLGSHALHSKVCQDGECKRRKKKTAVKIKGKEITAWTESERMRWNFFGF